MTTKRLDPSTPSATGSNTADLGEAVMRRTYIFAVPASQRYYWSDQWQAGERETLRSLRSEHGLRFASGQEFAQWLLADDEDAEEAPGASPASDGD